MYSCDCVMIALFLAVLVLAESVFPQSKGPRATAWPIDGPVALALDGKGHLFVAAVDENRVYRVDLNRKSISIVAGNGKDCCFKDGMKASEVSLDDIGPLAVDSQGNLLIGEGTALRKVEALTGVITTIRTNAKLGSTTFQRVAALALNSDGDMFIADTYLGKVFKLGSTGGEVHDIAGNGKQGFSGDGGPAIDASFRFIDSIALDKDGNLLIADSENCRIRRVDRTSGVIGSIGVTGGPEQGCPPQPGTVGFLPTPADLVLAPSGDIFFLEPAMNVVMRLAPNSQTLSVVAGTGRQGFSGDGGLATKADLSGPSGLAIDTNGNLFISDYRNKRVRRVDARTKIINTIAGNGFPHTIHAEM